MAKEKWAKAYVQANIRKAQKGYHCKMPDLVAYPAGAVTMMIGKPVDQVSAPLLLAELLYEFNREVARLEQQSATPHPTGGNPGKLLCRRTERKSRTGFMRRKF